MTTIVYRDGVLAADTMLCCGDSLKYGVTKIGRGQDGRMGGACGSAAFNAAWVAWVKGEREDMPAPQKDGNGTDSGLLIHADGRVELFEHDGSFFVECPYFAIGSGSPEAMGALFVGADAKRAVEAAIAHDAHTGGSVTVLSR